MKKINLEEVVGGINSGNVIVVETCPTDTLRENIRSIAKDDGLKLLEDNYGLLSEAVHKQVLNPGRIQIYTCVDPRVTRSKDVPYLVGMISSKDWFNPRNSYINSEIVGTRLERGFLLIGFSSFRYTR